MKAEFHKGNRERLYAKLPEGSLLVMFSGEEITKTNDEYYPFFADRSFVYLTGLECKEAVLLAAKDAEGSGGACLHSSARCICGKMDGCACKAI